MIIFWNKTTRETQSSAVAVFWVKCHDVSFPNSSLYNETHTREMIKVKPLPTGSRITLSVSAVINHTLFGDKVTIHSYTGNSDISLLQFVSWCLSKVTVTVQKNLPLLWCFLDLSPISNLTLKSGQDNIVASWHPPNYTDISFTVTLRLNGTDIVTKHNLTEPEEKFQGLKSGTRYTVIVWAVGGHLKSPPVESSKFTCESLYRSLSVPLLFSLELYYDVIQRL